MVQVETCGVEKRSKLPEFRNAIANAWGVFIISEINKL